MSSARFLHQSLSIALIAMLFGAQLAGAPSMPAATTQARAEGPFDEMIQLRATASRNGVLLEWTASFELGTLGFNVYRVSSGARAQLNSSLIAGGALVVQRAQSYSWFDADGTPDSTYEVESIDLKGESAAVASIRPSWSVTPVTSRRSALLAQLGNEPRKSSEQIALDENKSAGSNKSGTISAESLNDQWTIANQPALKIGVRTNGWYRIMQPAMATAGFDTTGDAANLRLFVGGNEIAMGVSRSSGQLTASDFIEFWGQGLDTATADTQIYWLVNGSQPGKRIVAKAELHPTGTTTPTTSTILPPIKVPRTPLFWFPGVTPLLGPRVTDTKSEEPKSQPAEPISATPVATLSEDNSIRPAEASARPEKPFAKEPDVSLTPKTKEISADVKPSLNSPPKQKAATSNRHLPGQTVRRKRIRRKTPSHRHRHHAAAAVAATPAFTSSVQRKDRTVYYSAALNGVQENYFGAVVFGDGPVVTLALHNIEFTSTAPAQLQVALQGVSVETHQVKVFINGSLAGTISFANQNAVTQTFSLTNSWLVEGDNAIKLVPVGSSHDTSVVDYLRVSYPHSFRADSDALQFNLRSTQSARIDGFSVGNIRVLDISDPSNVQVLHPIIESSGAGFAATIPAGDRGKARRLIALPANRISQPALLTLNQPSTLNRNTNAADFLIISYEDFMPALPPLVAQRQAQGFTVMVVDVENIFDEFSYGVHNPQAIRDFLALAKTTWARAPSYVLLVGDASFDPRNYSGAGYFDFVPTKEIDTGVATEQTALETASDDWFTDFNGDGIADISTGRLPVRTLAEANQVVSKIVNYAPANTPQSAMLVADSQGTYYFNFEAADDQVGATLPGTMALQKVYRRLQASDADARANIISNFNSGQAVTVYSGHGNVNIWGGSIFTSNDAAALTNGNRLPFVAVMDCLNGYFADPTLQSL